MNFNINGRVVRWPDGTDGVIQQDSFEGDKGSGSRRAFVVRLRVVRAEKPDISGALRFTTAAHGRMPGRDDTEKADAVALKLVSWVAQHGLTDGFFFRVEVENLGIGLFEA